MPLLAGNGRKCKDPWLHKTLRIKKSWRLKPRQEIHTTPMSSEHRGEGQKNVRARDYGETGRGTEKYRLLSKTWPWQPPTQSSSVYWHRSQLPNSRLWRESGLYHLLLVCQQTDSGRGIVQMYSDGVLISPDGLFQNQDHTDRPSQTLWHNKQNQN